MPTQKGGANVANKLSYSRQNCINANMLALQLNDIFKLILHFYT